MYVSMRIVNIVFVCLIVPDITSAASLWIEPREEDLVLVEGDKLRLDCIHQYAHGENSEGMFKKDGKIISVANDNGYSISLQKHVLESGSGIESTITLSKDYVTVKDSGTFACDIQTKHISISVIIIKVVPEDAEILDEPVDYVELSCGVQNPPETLPQNISWTWLNSNTLLQSNNKYSIFNHGYDGILRIKNPDRNDIGKYECLLGKTYEIATRKSTYTHLKAKPSIAEQSFKIDGQGVRFFCKALGYPRPVIIWYKENNVLNTSRTIDESEVSTTSTLHIENINTSDDGKYQCAAYSDLEENVTISHKFVVSPQMRAQAALSGVECLHESWNKRHLFLLLIVSILFIICDVLCS